MHKPKKILVLVSGGMDSAVVLAKARKEAAPVGAISFQYGSHHMDAESEAAMRVCAYYHVDEHHVIDLPVLGKHTSALTGGSPLPEGRSLKQMEAGGVAPSYVPARNTVFLSIAASVADDCGYTEIWYGAHQEDHVGYPDCRPEYVHAMRNALALGTKNEVVLRAPFIGAQKAYIVREGMRLHVPFELTHSCYRGMRPPCSTCDTCIIRANAFQDAGHEDPLLKEALWKR